MKKTDSKFGFGYDPRQDEMEAVVAKLKQAPKRPASDKQEPSTQAVLNRPKELDVVYQARPIPIIAQLSHNNMRSLTPEEVMVEQNLRRKGHNNTQGKTEPPQTASPEKREQAAEAWLYSPGTRYEDLTEEQRAQITEKLYYDKPSKVVITEPKKFIISEWLLNNLVLTFIIGLSPLWILIGVKTIQLLWLCLKGTYGF